MNANSSSPRKMLPRALLLAFLLLSTCPWTLLDAQTPPNAPSNLVANAVSASQINLSWTDNSSDEAGFKIERSIDGTNFTQIAQVLTNAAAFRNKGIWPGTTYFYRLRAYNGGGDSSFSNVASARTADACSSSVVGWGENIQGETTPPAGLNDAVALAAGSYSSLALKSDGTVVGWGGEPTPPLGLTGVVAIAVGGGQSIALKGDGTVVGWGFDGYGLTPPAGLTGVVAIAGGDYHSIALTRDGTVVGWGDNTYGQTTTPSGLAGVVAISAGYTHSIALKSDGTVVGWGHNGLGEATPPAGLTGVIAISAGFSHSLALKSDGTVVGWGDNSYAQRDPPAGLTGVVAIAAGQIHSLALMDDGTVVGWGNNAVGQRTPPAGLSGVMSVAAHYHSLALTCAPYAPSSLSAATVSSNQIDLAWTDQSTTEDGFSIERALDVGGAPGAWTQVVVVVSNVVVYGDSGLTWNTGYWYRVQARNTRGNSPYSNQASANTGPPSAPSGLMATAIATNQINLSWTDNSGDEAGFLIERAPDNAGTPGPWTQAASVSTNVIAYSNTALTENTKYWYRVRAYKASGNSPYSNQASATTAPPTAPSVLIATTVSTNQIRLSWTDNSNEEVGFLIERAPDNGGVPGMWTQIGTVSANVVVYSDTGLAANTRYWYRVRAFNAVGNSGYGDQAAAWAGLFNSWVNPGSDLWQVGTDWSLSVPPDNTHWAIFVTNANTKTVTINATTSSNFPGSMTASNLTLSAPTGSTNTLFVAGVGTNLPLTVLASLSIGNGGVLLISNSSVKVSGLTNSILSLGGSVVLENGSLLVSNVAACGQDPGSPGLLTVANGTGSFSGTLCMGLNTNSFGSVAVQGGQLALTNGPAVVGFYGTGQMVVSSGSTLTSDRAVVVGLGAGSQGAITMDGSSWTAGEHLVAGQDRGATGTVQITAGQLTVTNTSLTLIGGAGSGQHVWSDATITVGPLEIGADPGSQGTLTVAGGSTQVEGALFIGTGISATGVVWMTGGQLVATNSPTYVAYWGNGVVTVSNGCWLGKEMLLGVHAVTQASDPFYSSIILVTGQVSHATVNVVGGSVTLLTKLVVGNCTSGGVGVVDVDGGSLFVTNAAHSAFIDVRNGQLNLNGGLLQTDRLVMTNTCGGFVRTGGTLIYGTAVLDPNRDDDGDGIPNGYEQSHGFDPLSAADANLDNDGDGLSNLQEFLAGTDPTNSASAFRITSVVTTGSDILVMWMMGPGKTNALQCTAGADDGSYETNGFADLFAVTNTVGTVTNYLDAGAATNFPSRFYRVRLVP